MKWLADENLRHAIVRGPLRREPGFDILRIRDSGLVAERDTTVLDWALSNDRVLVTYDLATDGAGHAGGTGEKFTDSVPIGVAIEEILLLDACSTEGDWAGGVQYLPLR